MHGGATNVVVDKTKSRHFNNTRRRLLRVIDTAAQTPITHVDFHGTMHTFDAKTPSKSCITSSDRDPPCLWWLIFIHKFCLDARQLDLLVAHDVAVSAEPIMRTTVACRLRPVQRRV
jgi:hypothetical protein